MRAKTNIVISAFALLLFASVVMANPVQIDWTNTKQDPLLPQTNMDELGDNFPAEELIVSRVVSWGGHVPCPADYTGGGAVQVQMQNMTSIDFHNVHYVADPETTLTNDDGLIGNLGMNDQQLAFRIDNTGVNTPLVFESIVADNIFQAGEVWEFVIQEFSNSLGGPAAPFDSLGIAGNSGGWPPSTGSIIAVPEPGTIAIMVIGMGALVIRHRFNR